MATLIFQEQGMLFLALAFLNSSKSQKAKKLKNSVFLLGPRVYLLTSTGHVKIGEGIDKPGKVSLS